MCGGSGLACGALGAVLALQPGLLDLGFADGWRVAGGEAEGLPAAASPELFSPALLALRPFSPLPQCSPHHK